MRDAGKSLPLAGDQLKSQAARLTFPRKFAQLRSAFGDDVLIGSEAGSVDNFLVAADQILRAAAEGPARLLGASGLGIGRLAVGARGDAVVLSVDFLTTATTAADVAAVVKGGHLFVRDGQWLGDP